MIKSCQEKRETSDKNSLKDNKNAFGILKNHVLCVSYFLLSVVFYWEKAAWKEEFEVNKDDESQNLDSARSSFSVALRGEFTLHHNKRGKRNSLYFSSHGFD